MSDDRTHYTGDSCPGGHMDLKACPTCGSPDRECTQRDETRTADWRCPDPWHSEPQKDEFEDALIAFARFCEDNLLTAPKGFYQRLDALTGSHRRALRKAKAGK